MTQRLKLQLPLSLGPSYDSYSPHVSSTQTHTFSSLLLATPTSCRTAGSPQLRHHGQMGGRLWAPAAPRQVAWCCPHQGCAWRPAEALCCNRLCWHLKLCKVRVCVMQIVLMLVQVLPVSIRGCFCYQQRPEGAGKLKLALPASAALEAAAAAAATDAAAHW